jgi:hypothetical protein
VFGALFDLLTARVWRAFDLLTAMLAARLDKVRPTALHACVHVCAQHVNM